MKKNKKVISLLVALTMVLSTFSAFVTSANAEVETYTQDYNDVATVADVWKAHGDIVGTILDGVLSLVNGSDSGNRGAWTDFSPLAAGTEYVVEFDLALTKGGDRETEFYVRGADSTGHTGLTGSVTSGYIMKIITTGAGSANIEGYGSVPITSGTSYHYKVATKENVSYTTITDAADTKIVDNALTMINGTGGFSGLYTLLGRQNGGVLVDNIEVRAPGEGEIPDVKYYTATINSTRFAVLKITDGNTYYADSEGKIVIPLLTDKTVIDYTLSKEGYKSEDGKIEIAADNFVDEKPLTVNEVEGEIVIFYESDFGNAEGIFTNGSGGRNSSVSLGSIETKSLTNVSFDVDFGALGSDGNSHSTLFLQTEGGKLLGIEASKDKLTAFTGWTGSDAANGSADVATYNNSIELDSEAYQGRKTVNFVIDKINNMITVSCGELSGSLPFTIGAETITGMQIGMYRSYGQISVHSISVTEPDPNYMSISGDNQFAKIPNKTVVKEYKKAEVAITPGETFEWSITKEDMTGVSIDAETGVLLVEDTATAGVATIKCTGTTEKFAEYKVEIEDFANLTSVVIDGARSVKTNASPAPTLEPTPEPIEVIVPFKDADNAIVIYVTESDGKVVSVAIEEKTGVKAGVPVEIKSDAGTKVYLWDSLKGMVPLANPKVIGEKVAIQALSIAPFKTKEAEETYTLIYAIDEYGDIVTDYYADMVEWSSTNVNVASINAETGAATVIGKGETTITGTLGSEGKKSSDSIILTTDKYSLVVDATGNSTSVDLTTLVKDENITEYLVTTATADGALVEQTKVAYADSIIVDTTGAVKVEVSPIFVYKDLGDVGYNEDPTKNKGYYISLPDDMYDITIQKAAGGRADVYANKQMLVNNLDQNGSGSTKKVGCIETDSGYIMINTVQFADGANSSGSPIAAVTVEKTPEIVTREATIYILGDSLVAEYYNGGSPENPVVTGWGQTLYNYLAEGTNISNLGNSGVIAEELLTTAFTQVIHSAKAGDYVILESGYNDKTKSTEEKTKAAVKAMTDFCKENGVNIVLVTPNSSNHTFGGENGGVAGSSWMRDAAETENVPLIDLALLSQNFFNETYGGNSEIILNNYNVSDRLHSKYNAAMKWAEIIAQGIYDLQQDEATAEAWSGIKVNTGYSYNFTDTEGNVIEMQVKGGN